ncbi:LytR family transcriptional regulator, partial [Amycolatopsis mediterranei]
MEVEEVGKDSGREVGGERGEGSVAGGPAADAVPVEQVNLVGFYSISQVIGGVPVCLKQATRDSFSGA